MHKASTPIISSSKASGARVRKPSAVLGKLFCLPYLTMRAGVRGHAGYSFLALPPVANSKLTFDCNGLLLGLFRLRQAIAASRPSLRQATKQSRALPGNNCATVSNSASVTNWGSRLARNFRSTSQSARIHARWRYKPSGFSLSRFFVSKFSIPLSGRSNRPNQFILSRKPFRCYRQTFGIEREKSRAKTRQHTIPHMSRLSFSDLTSELSRFSTHCLSCVSRTRHCPPTLKAGS